MNKPKFFVLGKQVPHIIEPKLLMPESFRHHLAVCSLEHEGKPVVMWTQGATSTGGYEEGTHDSIRDGSLSGKTDTRFNYVHYSTQKAWVEAGNELPN